MSVYRVGLGVLLAGMLAVGWLGCSTVKVQKRPSKQHLMARVKRFNLALRWKRYDIAGRLLHPSVRTARIIRWEKERGQRNITDFAIRDVQVYDKGTKALVLVVYQQYKLPSMSVRRVFRQQRWETHKGVWVFADEVNPALKKKKGG